MVKTSRKFENIPPYLFAGIDKMKAAAIKRGVDIINLGIGDPDQPTFKRIVDVMHTAIDNPSNHNYPPYEGTASFRTAVATWYKNRFNVDLDPDTEVISLIGSKEGLAHLFYAYIDPGDIVLVPSPGYPVYKMGTILTDGIPFFVPLLKENNFLPDLDAIPADIVKKAKIMFVNYPNNPTAAIADLAFYEKLVAWAKKNDILIASDLAYSEMTYDGYIAPSILEVKGAKDVAIEFHSLSKSFNMTGWRIGMAVGNKEAVNALSTIKTNVDSGIFKAIQEAGIEALTKPSPEIAGVNKIYQERRDVIISGLQSLGLDIKPIKATFYVWAPVPKGYSSADFVSEMLNKCGIVVVPGNGYGPEGEGYFRIALTEDVSRLKEAINRMKDNGINFC
ncbi:MAG: LL-diaminopimelate aminotransferase [Candidatus Margulisbacteria bacterium GWF2_35_9]|nr:MAG: LL-diaminopimelate aminotransferase [Candidatus Margulisbacteria bacterium GWF2_35_9]